MTNMLQGVLAASTRLACWCRGCSLRVERLHILILAAPAGYMWMQPMQAPWPCCPRCASTLRALNWYRWADAACIAQGTSSPVESHNLCFE